jgi:HPt (histidine-containing phosphotransfer) domain-containing protein
VIAVPSNEFEAFSKEAVASELGVPPMFIDKLSAKFMANVDSDIANLESVVNSGDVEGIKQVAHKIKGAAANLRFKYLSELFKTVEYSAKDGLSSGYDDLLVACKNEVANIKGILG